MSRISAQANEDSRAMKIALFVSSVLGLLVGLATGVPEGKALAARLFSLRTRAIERELSAFSSTQFQHADSEHARQAVLSEIRALEALQHLALRLPPKRIPQNQLSQDQILKDQAFENQALYIAYARLSLIEEAAGQAPAAKAALAKAAAQWRMLHPGGEVTPEQVRQAVRDFDNEVNAHAAN